MPSPENGWRDLSRWEREVLERMLEQPFDGRDALREQLARARVRRVDDEGSLSIEGATPTEHYWPAVTARGEDADGIAIEMILLVGDDDRINELDVWKGDGSPIKQMPKPSALEIWLTPKGSGPPH